jgi:hypothetical protein
MAGKKLFVRRISLPSFRLAIIINNRYVQAIVCSLLSSPDGYASCAAFPERGLRRSRGRAPPPGGREASIFLGGGDPFNRSVFRRFQPKSVFLHVFARRQRGKHYRRIALPSFWPAKTFFYSILFGQKNSVINSVWRKICLLRSVLAMVCSFFGSHEEAAELLLAALALRFPAPGSGALAGRGPRPGGAWRIFFWAAAIRFSQKVLFRSVFRRFLAQNNGSPIRFA